MIFWRRYITQAKHGKYLAGTSCWVRHENLNRELHLRFADGVVFGLSRSQWFLRGIEPDPPKSFWQRMAEETHAAIDREIFAELGQKAQASP